MFDCPEVSHLVLSTIGQAFELRYKLYLNQPTPNPLAVPEELVIMPSRAYVLLLLLFIVLMETHGAVIHRYTKSSLQMFQIVKYAMSIHIMEKCPALG